MLWGVYSQSNLSQLKFVECSRLGAFHYVSRQDDWYLGDF